MGKDARCRSTRKMETGVGIMSAEYGTPEWDFEWIKGQWHYQSGGRKDDLRSNIARAGWEEERFHHEKKTKKAESN